MKRLPALFLSLALAACLIPAARADVLWEPNNSFYQTHYEDCTYVGRGYYANGPEGFVTLWDAPDGSAVSAQYENGFTLYVYWRYEDWGCITVWGDEGSVDGWVPLSHLSLIYDHLAFEEEYGDRFRDYDGEFAAYTNDGEDILCWPYPGAAEPGNLLTPNEDTLAALTGSGESDSYISRVFTDEAGLTWGFVPYLHGYRNFWICLDDPTGAEFPLRAVEQEPLIPGQTPQTPAVSTLPYLLVAGVALVTTVLLIWFYILRKRTSRGFQEK